MPVLSAREKLLKTANELFARDGYHATGIDRILAESGVAKKTLYNHFRSKDELVLAALRHRDSLFRNDFMRSVEAAATAPRDRLLAVFDVAEAWFRQPDFFGCPFIKAVGEYSAGTPAIRNVCREFKTMMRNYIRDLALEARAQDPEALADQLDLLLEGAIVTAQVCDQPTSARTAKMVARQLIEQACPAV